jgi:hypothetical protein
MGPSVGWVNVPVQNVLAITTAGTYQLDPSTSLVTVNVAGAVTIILPTAIDPTVPAGALPGLFANNPITIVDIGGHASAFPITIQPFSVFENIVGLASIQIRTDNGGFTLLPLSSQQGWSSISP